MASLPGSVFLPVPGVGSEASKAAGSEALGLEWVVRAEDDYALPFRPTGARSVKVSDASCPPWEDWQVALLQELSELGHTLEAQLQEHCQRQELLLNQQTLRLEAALHEATLHERASPQAGQESGGLLLEIPRSSMISRESKERSRPEPSFSRLSSPKEGDLNAKSRADPTSPPLSRRSSGKEDGMVESQHGEGNQEEIIDCLSPDSIYENGKKSSRTCKQSSVSSNSLNNKSRIMPDMNVRQNSSVKDRNAAIRTDDVKLLMGDRMFNRFANIVDWWFDLREPEREGFLARLVMGKWFDLVSTLVILANTAATVATTNYEAKFLVEDHSATTKMLNTSFVVFYSCELLLRLIVHRVYFFCNEDMLWNLFDMLLVNFAVFELLFSNTLEEQQNNMATAEVTHMRTVRISLRILRTAKTLRVVRVIRFFAELRLLMSSVLGSMSSLFWSIIVLAFMFFIFSLVFVQGATMELISNKSKPHLDPEVKAALETHMGSTQEAMLMLFKSTTGGDDWSQFFMALSQTGWANRALFLFFIAFAQIALLNILTGIFVENAMRMAEPDRDSEALHKRKKELKDADDLRKLCRLVDSEGTGKITEQQFMQKLKSSQFRARLSLLGLDIKDAALFFQVVSSGYEDAEVDIDAFVAGAMRLKGAATSLDLQALMFRTRLIYANQMKIMEAVQSVGALNGTPPPESP